MIHFILSLVCIVSVEIFVRLDFLSILDSFLKVTRKVTYIIPKNNISDHWKEKVIPVYSLKIMNYSLQILIILMLILSLFMIANFFISDFFAYTLSLIGVIESIVFAYGYVFIRKSFIK